MVPCRGWTKTVCRVGHLGQEISDENQINIPRKPCVADGEAKQSISSLSPSFKQKHTHKQMYLRVVHITSVSQSPHPQKGHNNRMC